MNRRNALRAALAVAMASIASRGRPLWGDQPLSTGPLTQEQIRAIGREAYLWAWPLVFLLQCRNACRYIKSPGRSGGAPAAPLNQLAMMTDYISPTAKAAPCPNQDVIYGFGMLDLAKQPLILQVPDFDDRFWLYQLGDHRTDRFAKIGKMHNTQPGFYLIAGPRWSGEAPEGIVDVLRCPTRIGYCLPRVFMRNTPEDREAVQEVISQILLYPADKFDGEWKSRDWSKARWYPSLGQVNGERGKRLSSELVVDALPELLDEVPPLPGEEKLYAEFRTLIAQATQDAATRELLIEAFDEAEAEEMSELFEFRNLGERLPHGWTTIQNGAEFGVNYRMRAAAARSNIFVNASDEAKYFYLDDDVHGERLQGSQRYRIHFAAGALPPTHGFWSLTLYDEDHFLYPNPHERYAVGDKDADLRYNADGSLTIYVQPTPPQGWEMNWLPTPPGPFSLYLRAYWPSEAILEGRWTPPPVESATAPRAVAATSPSRSPSSSPSPTNRTVATSAPETPARNASSRRFAIRRANRSGRR